MPEGSLPSLPKRPTPPSIPAGRPSMPAGKPPIPARPSAPNKPATPTKPSLPTPPPPVPARPPQPVPAPPKPLPVAIDLQAEAESVLTTPEVVIRTMQDDLREARGGEPAAAKAAGVVPRPTLAKPPVAARGGTRIALPPTRTASSAPGAAFSTKSAGQAPAANAPLVPLPPKKVAGPQKVVMAPPIRRHHRSRTALVFVLILLIIMVGGGAFAWLRFGEDLQDRFFNGGQAVVPAAQVIPAGSALILQYEIPSGEERGLIISAWNAPGLGDPTVKSLLDGDPRLLLLESEVTSFYYVYLEDESRPYVVVPRSRRLQELFEANPYARMAEVEGWYVISSTSTGNYTAALAEGPLTQLGDDVFVTPATAAPLRIFLGPHALLTLRETLLGSELANGLLQEVSLAGRWRGSEAIEINGHGTHLDSGASAPGAAGAGTQANQQLLSLIPEEAKLVRIGSNFAQDVNAWGSKAGALDMAAFQQPQVAGFLQQLNTSYAFYSTAPNPAARDIGIIISLPAALRAEIAVPNQTVEEALSALLPLLTGRKGIAPIQFTTFSHAGVPLRYANFSQPSQALDYAVVDGYLLITTSRESMFAQLETAKGTHTSIDASPTWQNLLSAWGALPATANLVLGSFDIAQFSPLLPLVEGNIPLFGIAVGAPAGTSADVAGIVVLSGVSQ